MITEDVDCKMHHILVSKIEKKKREMVFQNLGNAEIEKI